MIAYRDDKLAPTLVVALVGGATIAAMIWMLGAAVLSRWFFYLSMAFLSFSGLCLATGKSRPWHRWVWRACQWWSCLWAPLWCCLFARRPFQQRLSPGCLPPSP